MRSPLPAFCGVLLSFPATAQPPVSIQLQLVNGGMQEPVALANAGDSRMFVVERTGRINILQANGSWAPQVFLDITDRVLDTNGEQGLLGLVFHPNYASNGFFYVNYVGGTGNGITRISRFHVTADPDVADPNSETIIFSVAQPYTNHNGGDLHFGPDGYLYIALGDGGGTGDPQDRSQNMTVPFGKMLRINVNSGSPYSIPASNPFATSPTIMHEIWANGFRNPWRFSFDRVTGDLWVGDVGQGLWEEVDRWPAGNNTGPNFGWRCYEGNATYNTAGCLPASNYVFPLNVQPHMGAGWCSVIGGYVYRGQNYTRLTGRYIYTDWCSGVFLSLHQNGATWVLDTLLDSGVMGFAAMGEDLNGEIYVADQGAGGIYRITDPYANVRVNVKAFLEGPFVSASDQMTDGLRTAGLVPLNEPFTDLGFAQYGSGHESTTTAVLAVTGNNAIVDWVHLQLRQSGAPGNIVATANALIQRDGDVVGTDGVSPVTFIELPGNYHVAIRHRHHLGCMTAGALALTATPTTIDFRLSSTATYGTAARKTVGTRQVLWAGNARIDNVLRYTGTNNDRDPILIAIGGVVPTSTTTGYLPTDLNMDGTVKYTGTTNDRDLILQNIGGVVPTNTRAEQLP